MLYREVTLKREYKFKSFMSYLFLVIGSVMVVAGAISYIFKPLGIDISFWLLIVAIFFIVISMYRILSFYVYLGEYALSIHTMYLMPRLVIPWREISDIEIQANGVIVLYRTAGRSKTIDINKSNFEKNEWETFLDMIIDYWKKSTKSI